MLLCFGSGYSDKNNYLINLWFGELNKNYPQGKKQIVTINHTESQRVFGIWAAMVEQAKVLLTHVICTL